MKAFLTFQEWKKIGNKAKEVRNCLSELVNLLNEKLPKTKYLTKWNAAEKAFGRLRSSLDDMVCGQFPDMADEDVITIFYGNNEKK